MTTRDESIIELQRWLKTAPGRYLLAWEQERADQAVADAFGFHALQLGLPELDGLRANRMPHRWLATDSLQIDPASVEAVPQSPAVRADELQPTALALHCDFDALPFPSGSVDLVVLPHSLELARDPHQALREVERVLVPEGRVVIIGFNPTSLWGLRQRLGRMRAGLGFSRQRSLYLPRAGDFIGYWRARDWLRLLGFEVEAGRFGCWRPPLKNDAWLQRFAWMDRVGDRWWPVLGAVYIICAVKRVRGLRLVGLIRSERRKAQNTPAVAARAGHASRETS
jgi:SAM-dependent methyltransferase